MKDAKKWKTTRVPKDRPVWLRANLVQVEDCMTLVEPFEGYAECGHDGIWRNVDRMAIAMDSTDTLAAQAWMELAEAAAGAPEREHTVMANVYCWDGEYRRESGSAGFFAVLSVSHNPTRERLHEATEGPYDTQAKALAHLVDMLGAWACREDRIDGGDRVDAVEAAQ